MATIQIQGRIHGDIKLRSLGEDKGQEAAFTLMDATRGKKDKEGNRLNDFFYCKAYGFNADFIAKYFGPGSWIGVHGKVDQWKGDDGRTNWTVIIDGSTFLGDKKDAY